MIPKHFRITPTQSKILVCALGLLVFAIDLVVPADLDVAIFYCFVIVLCAWTRSLRFLWGAAAVFTLATLPGLLISPPAVTGSVAWVDWANRVFGMGALLLVAAFIDLRMRSFQILETTVNAKNEAEIGLRNSQERLKLAQLAGGVGSWEWDPKNDVYTWSEECREIFGIEGNDALFTNHWMAAVNPADRSALRDAMDRCLQGGELEMDYLYEHPSRGRRWIRTRAKMLVASSGEARIFGISHDITERKQVEDVLKQSHLLLESLVEQRTAELRKLSAELLQSQDEERRRIARELHDSFGQYLASLKINLDQLAGIGPVTSSQPQQDAELLSDCLEIVQTCIVEIRTLSHLLHPPLLDEAGFASAARWYVEGFAKRSNIEVRLDLRPDFPRLPSAVELALFRALQESLTNVHRYSGSPVVDIHVTGDGHGVTLKVRDYGRGMPADLVQAFHEHRAGVGVGLSGMRERMNELGGDLELLSDKTGTTLRASIRIPNLQPIPVRSSNVA